MTQRPKDIGTWTETQVVKYLLTTSHFPTAERRALAGTYDRGDIIGTPHIAWEVKGGKQAETASDALIASWMVEAETERINAGADICPLVWKRKAVGGQNAGRWWAALPAWSVDYLLNPARVGRAIDGEVGNTVLRMTLADCVELLVNGGYSDAAAVAA